jgi:exonuclease VII small subunit
MKAIRYTANLAEEDPDGSLVDESAVAELEKEIEDLHSQSEELYEAAERLARACEMSKQGKRVESALANFREVTGG